MPKPPKKLTKKQLEEEAKRKKEEEKRKREEELEKKRKEEEYFKSIEEARIKKENEEKFAKEEIIRLQEEETKLASWKKTHESNLKNSYQFMINEEDWKKYSYCDEGYVNVRKESELNGFIYEFKEKCEFALINNFKLLEKNFNEEMRYFDYSQSHYNNLERLIYQGRASHDYEMIQYAVNYLNVIKDIQNLKIENMTKYFVETFESFKKKRIEEVAKKNKERLDEEQTQVEWEWSNDDNKIKLCFWSNNFVSNNYIDFSTNFQTLGMQISGISKSLYNKHSILRFFWCEKDIREYLLLKEETRESATAIPVDQFCPFMSISGCYFVEEIIFPSKSISKGNWEIRELVGNKYKASHIDNKDQGYSTSNQKMMFKIKIPNHVYLKDTQTVLVGLFNEDTACWNLDFPDVQFKKDIMTVVFNTAEMGIFSVLLERKINFPYKSWYLRTVRKDSSRYVALLDLVTPRVDLNFEIGVNESKSQIKDEANMKHIGYVKLIHNSEPEFSHFADQELTFDEIVLEFKKCGVLIAPWKEDLESVGIKEKNYETQDRAIDDIVMACRQYAIKSHGSNSQMESDVIMCKIKENCDYDDKFFDDEEKDWKNIVWFPNKCSIGNFIQEEDKTKFISEIETSRPCFHLIIKDQPTKSEIYDIISEDDESAGFLTNLRNFLRIIGIVNMP